MPLTQRLHRATDRGLDEPDQPGLGFSAPLPAPLQTAWPKVFQGEPRTKPGNWGVVSSVHRCFTPLISLSEGNQPPPRVSTTTKKVQSHPGHTPLPHLQHHLFILTRHCSLWFLVHPEPQGSELSLHNWELSPLWTDEYRSFRTLGPEDRPTVNTERETHPCTVSPAGSS